RLLRAAGRVVLWIEVEDDRLASEVGELDALAGVCVQLEIGCGLAFLDHSFSSVGLSTDANDPPRPGIRRARRDVGRRTLGALGLSHRSRRRLAAACPRVGSNRVDRPGWARPAAALKASPRAGEAPLRVR